MTTLDQSVCFTTTPTLRDGYKMNRQAARRTNLYITHTPAYGLHNPLMPQDKQSKVTHITTDLLYSQLKPHAS